MPYTKAITIIFSVLVIGATCNISANALNITNMHSNTSALVAFDTPAKKSVPSQQLEAGETPKGLSKPAWQSIQTQMRLGKYKAYQQKDGSYHSSNPNNGWRIAYAVDGTTTVSPYDKNSTENYHIAFRLDSVSYDAPENSGQNSLEKPVAISFENNRLNYQWNNNITEYWINSEEKLEQWFEIKQRPQRKQAGDQQGLLQVQMILDTDLKASLQDNALSLRSNGLNKTTNTITYDKLKVWDATGKIMLAQMQLQDNLLTLLVDDKTAVYPLTIDPTLAQQAYLKASNTDEGDVFGGSVSISGDTLVIGAPSEASNATGVNGNQSNNSANNSGAAYVFTRNGTSWTQQAYLKASNTERDDRFGGLVSISGDTLVISALRESSNATGVNGAQSNNAANESGAAYVFTRSGTNWSQQAYLKASNTDAGDEFGNSVSISGDTLMIGARSEASNATGVNGDQSDNSANKSGAAYVFTRSGTNWSQQAYLKASNTNSRFEFGGSVSVSGDTLVIGSTREDSRSRGVNGDQSRSPGGARGAAYVFTRNGTNWSQQAYLKASNTNINDSFGVSVSISGDTLVIGASAEDSNATGVNGDQSNNSADRSGAAYVFTRSGTNWSQQAYLKASNTDNVDIFGRLVAISGDTLVIGAPLEDSNATGVNGNQTNESANSAGAAYVFTRSGTNWSQQAYLKASNTGSGHVFGGSVSVSESTVVVGASGEASNAIGVNGDQTDDSANRAGAAYVFNFPTDSLVGGGISGLVGSISLQNNGADDITLNMNGPFTFSAQHDGSTYEVTVSSQPATQICTVANGTGTLVGIDINNVSVSCKADTIFFDGFEALIN